MDKRPIGVFDSGLGGLSVIKELSRVLPDENIVYFGDTGRLPYGTKSNETIIKYATEDEKFLLSFDVKLIIAACGTVSSVARKTGEQLPVPFIEVVTPAAKAAAKATKNKIVGVIGTAATVRSDSYKKAVLEVDKEISLHQVACPLFVQLVEEGFVKKDDEITRLAAEHYLKPLKEKCVDTLILGCTHFPAISEIISDIMGEDVTLINTGEQAAKAAAQYLKENDMMGSGAEKHFFVSDRAESFKTVAGILLGSEIEGDVKTVNLQSYLK